MSDAKIPKMSDVSNSDFNVISIQELQEARILAEIIYKAHGLRFKTSEVVYEGKIQRQEAKLCAEA